MFEESKDTATAEKEYLDLLGDISPKEKQYLLHKFAGSFKKYYERNKKRMLEYDEFIQREGSSLQKMGTNGGTVAEMFTKSYEMVRLSGENVSREKEARLLGGSLGILISTVEYGITIQGMVLRPQYPETIIYEVRRIVAKLKILNKHVKPAFVRKRFIQIMNKHKTHLDPLRLRLLTQIAAEFS